MAEGFALETLPEKRAGEFYEEATRGRSASHHLQLKAALSLLYRVLGAPNPFSYCQSPKFAPEKIELRYHTASQLGELLRELRNDRRSYFGHLTYHLAAALFFTGCRYHDWARLTLDRLVREPVNGTLIAARLQVKGGSFRDLPLTPELAGSLEEWFAFLESVKACGCGVGESISRARPSSSRAAMERPLATRPSTPGSSSRARERGCRSFPPIPCATRPRRCCLTNAEPTCATSRPSWDPRAWPPPPATPTSIASGSVPWWETSACNPKLSAVRPKAERVGEIAAKAVVQLLFSTGKSFAVDGLREKPREFFREEVRAEVRAVASLSNVELITALLASNRQLALVGLQLRIVNGVVSLLTTRVENKALAAYVSEQSVASGNLQMTATLEVLACIAFRQPISRPRSTGFSAPISAGSSSNFAISSLWRNSPVPMAVCALRPQQNSCSVSAWQVYRN